MENYGYLKCVLNKRNEFRANLSIGYDELTGEGLSGLTCKIDTGASRSSLTKLDLKDEDVNGFKEKMISNGINFAKHYGINDTKETRDMDKLLIETGNLKECKHLSFYFDMQNVKINNYNLGTRKIGIGLDRTGNILIGMDILKELDIHIGTDKNTNKCVLLACKKDEITPEYRCALKSTFGILME